nr:ankyrin repeat-containing protein At5g02620-like [Ipomoea batatas]
MASSSQALPQNPDDVAVDYIEYWALYRAILAANWEETQIFFNQNPAAIRSPINNYLETALHVAAKAGNASFMEKLVALLLGDNEVEALGPRDAFGNTPLHFAARHGNIEVAHILVRRNSNLLYLPNNDGWFPIHFAAANCSISKDPFLYFLSLTRDDEYGQPNPYAGPTGATILVTLILTKVYGTYSSQSLYYGGLGYHCTMNPDLYVYVLCYDFTCLVKFSILKIINSIPGINY